MIAIKYKDGSTTKTRCEIELNNGSIRHAELMKEDYVELKFSLLSPCAFQLGDFIDFSQTTNEYPLLTNIGRFELVSTQDAIPTYNKTTGGYDYSLKLQAYYRKWDNRILKLVPNQYGTAAVWTITDTIVNIGKVIISNLNTLGFKYYKNGANFVIDVQSEGIDDPKEMLTISFDGTGILTALHNIAALANDGRGCDVWVEANHIKFGRCASGDVLEISRATNAVDITRQEGEKEYANKLYAFGAEQNIPGNYRKDLIFTITNVVGSSFADKNRKLTRDMFNEDAIINGSQPKYYSFETGKTSAYQASSFVNDSLDIKDNYITWEGHKQFTEVEMLLPDGRYSLKEYNEQTSTYIDLNLQGVPDSVLEGTATIELFVGHNGTNQRQRLALCREAFKANTDSNGNCKIQVYPDFIKKQAVLDSEYISGLVIIMAIGLEIDTASDLSEITAGQAVIIGALQFENHATPFYAKIRTRRWKSSAYAGKNYWAKIEPSRYFYNTLITPGTLDDIGRFTPQSLAPNAYEEGVYSGDTFSFIENDEGKEFLMRAKVPYNYFSARYDQSLNGVVINRLMLPDYDLYQDAEGNITPYNEDESTKVYAGEGYVVKEGLTDQNKIVEAVQYFDDIKPSYDGTISKMGLKLEEEKDSDGNLTGADVYNYVIFDTLLKNFKNDYSLTEGNLEITFSSGKLNGLTFEIEVFKGKLDDGTRADGTNNKGTWFKVVPSESYGATFPNQYSYPVVGDTYNISGYDTSLIDSALLQQAEIKLWKKAKEWLDSRQLDQGTYTAIMQSLYSKRLMVQDPEPTTDLLFDDGTRILTDENSRLQIEAPQYTPVYQDPPYFMGRKVKITEAGIFGNQPRETRIIGFEYPLDFPYDSVKLTCGETSAYSRLRHIEKQISKLE